MRGTNPYIRYTLPFAAAVVAKAKLTFKQGEAVALRKTDFTPEGDTLTFQLTREETCRLPDDAFVMVQLEVETTGGDSLVTPPEQLYTGCLLDEEAF